MIQEAFNGMITLMLAKFMLNDVSHMLNLGTWRPGAIKLLNGYIMAHNIRPNVLTEIRKQADQISDPEGLKTVIAGYYLTAIGTAKDFVVDDVANSMIAGLKEYARTGADEETIRGLGGVEAAHEYLVGFIDARAPGFYDAYDSLVSATTRPDKAIAIDRIMHFQHEHGSVLTEFFGYDVESSVETGLQKLLVVLSK